MEKFNNTGILTGYIKQLLHNFNLPKYRIYTKENELYHEWAIKNNSIPESERTDLWIKMPEENVLETITKDREDKHYHEYMRYIPYIKDGLIQEYINGEWVLVGDNSSNINDNHIPENNRHMHTYEYGKKILNYTKNLKITNNVYDSYTHEYLGDYLRFQRDYNNINLMPLYNCFSNRACDRLCWKEEIIIKPVSFPLAENQENFDTYDKYVGFYINKDSKYELVTDENKTTIGIIPYGSDNYTKAYRKIPEIKRVINFDTNDKAYKIYMVPVKLFKEYTIAIDSDGPIEFFCGLYSKYQETREKFAAIPGLTYKKVAKSNFNQPFLYSELLNITQDSLNISGSNTLNTKLIELAQNEQNLKLFIKLPINNTSTIVILEGNYLNWNDCQLKKQPEKYKINNIVAYGNGIPTTETATNATEGDFYLNTLNGAESLYVFKGNEWVLDHYFWLEDCAMQTVATKEIKSTLKLHEIKVDTTDWGDEYTELEDYIEQYQNAKNITIRPSDGYYSSVLKTLIFNIDGNEPYTKTLNNAIINMDEINNKDDITLITTLQLLRANTKEQIPFADRLIEYLVGNTITCDDDEISDNIKRVQKIMKLNNNTNNYYVKFPGIWDNRIKKIAYDYMNRHTTNFEDNHDLLGFIDKDTERNYMYTTKINGKKISTSISNAELEEGDFK